MSRLARVKMFRGLETSCAAWYSAMTVCVHRCAEVDPQDVIAELFDSRAPLTSSTCSNPCILAFTRSAGSTLAQGRRAAGEPLLNSLFM